MFHVGQKVVCVDVAHTRYWKRWLGDVPVLGAVYTVEGFFNGDESLVLVEIKNISVFGFGYKARRFRPIVERKTDISIFTEMLTGNKIGADA